MNSPINKALQDCLDRYEADRIFALTDANVHRVVPVDWNRFAAVKVIPAGEGSKNIETAIDVWQWLTDSGATRQSILVNIGGGVVTDLGGFTAATFKRGIRFINFPTTLLAIADAAIGGKTGIDFAGLKNEVGVFAPAEEVIICPEVLDTLPEDELRSGFAEVVKMAILIDADIYRTLLRPDALHDKEVLGRAMKHAAEAKRKIVEIDPREKGLRRILNFGHTAGHAYESYAAKIGLPISHGMAVAHGMLFALQISNNNLGLPATCISEYRENILDRYYGPLPFGREAESDIMALMMHDKKNRKAGEIDFVLIPKIGGFAENL